MLFDLFEIDDVLCIHGGARSFMRGDEDVEVGILKRGKSVCLLSSGSVPTVASLEVV